MSAPTPPRLFWERFPRPAGGGAVPTGEQLAALRRGLGREPGTVATMWPYYARLRPDGAVTGVLHAEHLALVLFALHQQSQSTLVHRPGQSLGRAALRLRSSGSFSDEAVDRRFTALATSTSVDELGWHLRSLVSQIRAVTPLIGLDYTRLLQDLVAYADPAGQGPVRRRWGAAYFDRRADADADADQPPTHEESS